MVASNSASKVSSTGNGSTDSPGLRRSVRENAWGKQPSPISKTPLTTKSDYLTISKPSSSRKSERLEKVLPTPVEKKSQEVEEQESQLETQKETPSPLRRSERSKKQTMSNPSSIKRKVMSSRTYKALFSAHQGSSSSSAAIKNDLETALEVNQEKIEEKLSSRYVEYWVPVSISTVQLEQYCGVLLENSSTLRSSMKELFGVLQDVIVSTRKCCDHPYTVDQALEGLLMKQLFQPEILDVGIKASGKLQLLDTILSEIRNKGLRVLILFKNISGSGRGIGDILDDFLQGRFGQDSYERVDQGLPNHRKQTSVNRFNDKNSDRFVFLLEIRACQSSIKLSSVDAIIIFNSDWNPSLDLRALNRMPIDSSLKQIKIFRLYSPFTLEEKVLILAAQNVTLDNSLHNINRSTSHQLLQWGASYLFKKLDLFHDADTACSDMSLVSPILKDVVHEILGLVSSHDDVHIENSLIVKVKHSEGTYSKNLQLLGERELQNVLDESQLFWANLLDGRNPRWKYPSRLLQRNRKRVNNFNQPIEASKDELDVVKKKKKTDNIPISPSPELGRNETEPIEKGGLDLGGLQPVCGTESSKEETSDMPQNVHLLLKSNMEKVSDVLQLPDDVKIMAGDLLDYIIDNHSINMEPESIFQAFQISLCWNAASLVKNKIYKEKSLATVKKLLKFSCTEEEANHAYSKMRDVRKKFSKHIHSLKEPKYSKDVVSVTDDGPIGLPLAERGTCHLQALNVSNAETDNLIRKMKQDYAELLQNFLRQCPLEKGIESHFKKIEENYGEHLERLMLQQQEEIHDMEKDMEQKREEINTDYRVHASVIRSINVEYSLRSDKLKKIVEDFRKRMEVHHQQKEARLRELQEKHEGERIVETKKATDKLKSLLPADFPGDSALNRFEPVVVGEHVLSIGSQSATCAKEKTDKPSDELKPVSSESTCIDDQSNIQTVNGAVGFTMKPRGNIAIDTLPGVLNRESEQQPHCSSADNLEESNLPLQQAPDKDPSKEPSKSSSAAMEVSDNITATELIAEHCQTDETNLVVIDDMRNQNDEITRSANSANSDNICCEEAGSIDRECLQQEPLDCSKSSSMVMEVRNYIIATELIAENCRTDKPSLVVIDEMRNQNDEISRSANSDNICCEEPGIVDIERLQQESIIGSQATVDSHTVSGPNDASCDKLHQVELPLLPNNPGPIGVTHGGEPGTVEMESLQQTLAGSTIVTDSSNVSVRNDQNCGEYIGNVDIGSSQQVSIAGSQAGVDSCHDEVDLPRVSDVLDQNCGEDIGFGNVEKGSSQQVSIPGSHAGVDSCNDEADLPRVPEAVDQDCGKDMGNVDRGSSQVSIAGIDSCNGEADLPRLSNVVETTTTTTDNVIPTPASLIAGSNEASGFAIKPMNICSSSQVMTTSVQAEGSAVLLQETTQTPVSHHPVNMHGPPTVQNQFSMHNRTNIVLPLNAEVLHHQYEGIRGEPPEQLIASRGLRSLHSVSVSPLGQGTQLQPQPPMLSAQPMILNFPNHNMEVDDPLSNETDRISKEMEKYKNSMDVKMSLLESARAKELEEINQKYNAIIHETETAFSSNINQLQVIKDRLLHFKTTALSFHTKNAVKSNISQSASPSISNMQQFTTGRLLGRQTTDVTRTSSTSVLTNYEMIAPSPVTHSGVQAPMISNMRGQWTPHRPSLTPAWVPQHRPSLTNWAPTHRPSLTSWVPPHRPSLTPPTMINRQDHGEMRSPAPHLRGLPSYPSDHYGRPVSVRANVCGIRPEYINPLLTPVGSVADPYRQALPIAPSAFASARPIVMPTIQTQLGEVTVQAETSAPAKTNEVVCLSDDDEDAGSM
ncbi:uncharacterized protein LOC124924022 [Impatiens glandulifera]|uniref:uncharacterized protein LOC124924022 n=1 Tax=Impatiens glandulifera TaxID=253017 RepID=UPI001FB0E178|nr:uncharacterized protein LOC124924022 [Impatiens glandulifera]